MMVRFLFYEIVPRWGNLAYLDGYVICVVYWAVSWGMDVYGRCVSVEMPLK